MKKFNVKRAWIPNGGGAVYTLTTAGGLKATAIETAGAPIAKDGAVEIAEADRRLIEGIDLVGADEFARVEHAILGRDERLTDDVSFGSLPEGIRGYFAAVISAEIGADEAEDAFLSAAVAQARRAAGLSQDALAAKAGIPANTIRALESGANSVLGAKLKTIRALARALDLTIDELIGIG